MKKPSPTIVLTGINCDHNSTFLRGPAEAPELIRKALYSESTNLMTENGVELDKIPLTDIGDHQVEETDDAYLGIETIITPILAKGNSPLILGGDHAITYPVMKAMAQYHDSLTILHFDAHPDLYDNFENNRYSHACPFARIMEKKLSTRLVQVGIRTVTPHLAQQAEKFAVEIHQMNQLDCRSFSPDINTPLYISLDLDVLDPAFAPGVSHHEPGGMSVRDLLTIIQGLKCPVVGADIVEYNPTRDINSMTAMVAAKMVKELAVKMHETCNIK